MGQRVKAELSNTPEASVMRNAQDSYLTIFILRVDG
jgi:hypothetical protein